MDNIEKPRAIIDNIPVWCSHDKIIPCIDLKPNPKNPNTHPVNQIELLSKIIIEQGWRMPITVSNKSGYIVKGHGRLNAALNAGITKAPVDYQDYASEDIEHADMIADNKIAELAKFDDQLLEQLVKDMDEGVLHLTALGEDDLSNILGWSEKDAVGGQDDSLPEVMFSEELMLEHNYIILYFDNPFDWHVAVERFGLKDVKSGDPAEKCQKVGIGRVISGKPFLE